MEHSSTVAETWQTAAFMHRAKRSSQQEFSTNRVNACHPEALLLREGSPAIRRTEFAAGMAPPPGPEAVGPKSLAAACNPQTSPEILRAKEALQDDRIGETYVVTKAAFGSDLMVQPNRCGFV